MTVKDWVISRFYDMRIGYTNYMALPVVIGTAITVQYVLLIDRVPILLELFPRLSIFAFVAIMIFIPTASLFGLFHRKKVLPKEQDLIVKANPTWGRIFRSLLLKMDGTLSDKEHKEIVKLLDDISNGKA